MPSLDNDDETRTSEAATDAASVAPASRPAPLPGREGCIGLIALSTDLAVEPEWRRMLPAERDVAVYVSRVRYQGDCAPEQLRAMADTLADAAELLPADLDVIAYGCTSGTVNIGPDEVAALVGRSHPNVPLATPITGAIEAFRTLGVRRVGVVTPYVDAVNETITRFLAARDIDVADLRGFGLSRDADIAAVSRDDIEHALAEVDAPGVDALFVSCTALVTVAAIEAFERRFARPVITSNQAMLWQALRVAGYRSPIEGYGRLLRTE